MHIGILQTDSVLARFRGQFGDYPDMFAALLTGADQRRPTFTTFDVRAATRYPAAEGCDAYLVTGSRHSVYDDEPWIRPLVAFIESALAAGRKVVGICFGHQLIAHYFGGRTVAAEAGWGVGVHSTELISVESWMEPAQARIGLLSSHKDQVVALPDNARVIARSSFCPNAGYVIGEQVLTLQGHPEFTKPYAEALMRMRRELLGEPTYQRGLASLAEATHESLVARWILNFVGQG